jgi:hypothetical protein
MKTEAKESSLKYIPVTSVPNGPVYAGVPCGTSFYPGISYQHFFSLNMHNDMVNFPIMLLQNEL